MKWLLRNRQIRTWIWPWGESQEIPMQGQAGRQINWWGGRGIQAGGFSCLCGSSKLIKFVCLVSILGRCKLYIIVLTVFGVDLFLVSVLAGEICKWTWRSSLFRYVFYNLCGVFEISWTSFATDSSILSVESYLSKRSKGKTVNRESAAPLLAQEGWRLTRTFLRQWALPLLQRVRLLLMPTRRGDLGD